MFIMISGARPSTLPHRIAAWSLAVLASAGLTAGCYSLRWTDAPPDELQAPPSAIAALFAAQPGGVFHFELENPGRRYAYDPGEKDPLAARAEERMGFATGTLALRPTMPAGRVLADFTFSDGAGSRVTAKAVDLLRLVPKIDGEGDLQYPEMLLEEFTRYGVTFRAEHDEFELEVRDQELAPAASRTYRMAITNNCLDPAKWEMALTTADWSDFGDRADGPLNLNQDRMLAHVWFFLDKALYRELVKVKNPQLAIDPDVALDYASLSARAEQVVVPFDRLRKVRRAEAATLLEIGARSGRTLEPLDVEQHYKWAIGLFVNRDAFETYADLLETPLVLAEFAERGHYDPAKPKTFDYGWMKALDEVEVSSLENTEGGTFVELTLDGEQSPFTIRLGNVDLALLDEQSLFMVTFGINQYPLARRNSPRQNTLHRDQDLMPAGARPYAFLVDRETGRFVDNEKRGVERIFLGWDSIDRDTLEIYAIAYERVTPVWMAKLELNDELVDRTRVRRSIYGS